MSYFGGGYFGRGWFGPPVRVTPRRRDIWTQLARNLRSMAEASLPDRATIERHVRVRQPGGKIIETWQLVQANVPCHVFAQAPPTAETLTADQLKALNRWTISLPMSTAISEGMRVTVVGLDLDGATWVRKLNVVGVDGPRTYEVLRNATAVDPAIGAA